MTKGSSTFLSLLAAGLLTVGTSIAGGIEQPSAYSFSGFYAGADIGVASADIPFRLNYVFDDGSTVSTFDRIGALENSGVIGGVDFGYGSQMDHFYLGAFFEAQFFSLTSNRIDRTDYPDAGPNVFNAFSFQASVKDSFSIGLKPGFVLSPNTLFYLQAAAAWADVKFNAVGNTVALPAVQSLPVNNFNTRTRIGGFQIGFGEENQFAQHWSLFFKYLYSGFSSLTGDSSARDAFLRTSEVTARFRTLSTVLGIHYYFSATPYSAVATTVHGHSPFDAIYVGLYGGYGYMYASRSNFFTVVNTGVATLPDTNRNNVAFTGWSGMGGINAGGGQAWGRFFAGLVGHLDAKHYVAKVANRTAPGPQNINFKLDVRNYGGLDFKFGVLLDRFTLFYAKIGAAFTRTVFNSGAQWRNLSTPIVSIAAQTRHNTVVEFALGLEGFISKGFSIGVEDDFTFYQNSSYNQLVRASGVDHTFVGSYSPQTNEVLVRANFYFS